MAPAADMFEMGVKVQVLKRGTMFAMRAAKLYELYRAHDGLEDDPGGRPADAREDDLPRPAGGDLGADPGATSRAATRRRSTRAERDPKHKMALVFRWYLGPVVALGQRGRAVADGRLPGLVRPGDGGVQRVGARVRSWSRPRTAGWSTVALNILLRGRGALPGPDRSPSRAFDLPAGHAATCPAGSVVTLRSGRRDSLNMRDLPRTVRRPVDPSPSTACPPRRSKGTRLDSGRFPATRSGGHHRNGLPVSRWPTTSARFWSNIRDRLDAITEVPADPLAARGLLRRRPQGPRPDLRPPRRVPRPRSTSRSLDFGIAPNTLEATDTTQLLGLLVARQALDDAGYGAGSATSTATASA